MTNEMRQDKLTSLMKDKFGVGTSSRLVRTDKDTLYTFFKKVAKYLYKNSDADSLNLEEAATFLIPYIYPFFTYPSYSREIKFVRRLDTLKEHNLLKQLFPKEVSDAIGYDLNILLFKEEDSSINYYIIISNAPKFRNKYNNFRYYKERRDNYIGLISPDILFGYSKLIKALIQKFETTISHINQSDQEKYRVIMNDLLTSLSETSSKNKSSIFYSMVSEVREYVKNQRTSTVISNKEMLENSVDIDYMITKTEQLTEEHYIYSDKNIVLSNVLDMLDFIDDYLMSITNVVQMQQHNLTLVKKTRAAAWQEKKNINKTAKHIMATSSLLSHFSHLEIDDEVDPVLFSKFEKDVNVALDSFLPKLQNEPTLRLRKLGNYNDLGMYVPALNTIIVDPRDEKDYSKMNEPGISSFIHEYGHALDYQYTDLPISISAKFMPLYKKAMGVLKQYIDKFTKKDVEYLSSPSEIFARLFELYIAKSEYSSSLLLSWNDYKKQPIYNDLMLVIEDAEDFFAELFPNILVGITSLKKQVSSNTVETVKHIKTQTSKKEYSIEKKVLFKYYSIHRPIDLGTYPKSNQKPISITNFGCRKQINDNLQAWGYLEYANPLSDEELNEYELVQEDAEEKNKDLNTCRTYRYYAVRHQIEPGFYPKNSQKPSNIVKFSYKNEINSKVKAWGYLEYSRPLTDKEIKNFGLKQVKAIQQSLF